MKKLLFIFIIFVFSMSCKSTPLNSSPENVVMAEEPKEEINAPEKTSELYLPSDTYIRDTDRGRVFETSPKIIFKFVETNMPAYADKSFAKVIEFLEKNNNVNIILEAHTSNRGKAYPHNYNLSVMRARNGKAYLLERGVAEDRVIENPLGEALPEYPTQDELRRYEFIIIENEEDMIKYNNYISNLDVKKESVYRGN